VPTRLRALVRDLGRGAVLRPLAAEIVEVDYGNASSVRRALLGADAVVHLGGSLIPRPGDTLERANVATTQALVDAATSVGAKCFVYLSFPGADPGSHNAYLRTKGRAEKIIRQGPFTGAIFRVPMILDPDNEPGERLQKLAALSLVPLVNGGTVRIQPISQADVLAAIEWVLTVPPARLIVLDLVGPETLTYADLLRRMGSRLGRRPRILPIPKLLGRLSAALAGSFASSRGWNRAVFDTIFDEHLADPGPARSYLPFSLATVNEILEQFSANAG